MYLRYASLAPAAFGLLALIQPPLNAQSSCTREALSKPPHWISTLERSSDEILLTDPKSSELLAFNVNSGTMNKVSVPAGIPPSSITKIEGGFLIKDRDNGVILGSGAKAGSALSLGTTKGGGRTGLSSLYSNWVTRGSTFIGFGSVARAELANSQYDASRGFELGFVKGRVSAALGQFQEVELLEATEDNDLYLLGFPYFAANDDGLFFVRMVGDRAALMRVREGTTPALEELSAFPEDFRTVPKLGPNLGPSTTAPRFAQIEKQTMIVGLFGQGKFLYLLAREPDAGQGQQWFLFQINPAEPKPRGRVRLPTTANHLSVAVGPDYWYLFERGGVRGWGDQDIKTVVRVPTAWITVPTTSPLRPEASQVRCTSLASR